jgi:hypothetical protein
VTIAQAHLAAACNALQPKNTKSVNSSGGGSSQSHSSGCVKGILSYEFGAETVTVSESSTMDAVAASCSSAMSSRANSATDTVTIGRPCVAIFRSTLMPPANVDA